jgi:hypothetical protein
MIGKHQMAKNHPQDQFGILARDGRSQTMPFATAFTMRDASTPTPISSPLAYLTTTITLTVPDSAVRLVLTPSTALRISDDPAMSRYYVVPPGVESSFDVTLMASVYIQRDTTSGTLNFQFATV